MSQASAQTSVKSSTARTVPGPFNIENPDLFDTLKLMDFMSEETREEAIKITERASKAYVEGDQREAVRLRREREQLCREVATKLNNTYYTDLAARASITAPPKSDHDSDDETATQRSVLEESMGTEVNNSITPTDTTSSGELR